MHIITAANPVTASYRMTTAIGTMICHIVKAVFKIWRIKSKITATNLRPFSTEMENDISAWNWKWMTEARTMITLTD